MQILNFQLNVDECKNNSEKSSTTKVTEDISSRFSISTILSFKSIKNTHDVYRDEDCMKTFCKPLKDHKMETIKTLKKENNTLTNKQHKSHEKEKICHICWEKFKDEYANAKKYCKIKITVIFPGKYRGATHSLCNSKCINTISSCGFSQWFKLWFSLYHKRASRRNWRTIYLCRRKYWKKDTLFRSNKKRNKKHCKKGKEIKVKTISWKLKCIDNARFMTSSN